jgi:hydrogenase-4 membrane subunit HyfE
MKLEEIRKGYEETSGTFSSTVRTLAISGTAIAWLFMTREKADNNSALLIGALGLCVLTLIADLLQNYILSIKWYNFYKKKRNEGMKESEEVEEPESKNKFGWFFYHTKLCSLLIGYILIVLHLIL